VVRSGSSVKLYVDGSQLGSPFTNSSNITATTALYVGAWQGWYGSVNGWMDEIRVSKGVARWTANFTPPAQEYASAQGPATVVSVSFSESAAPKEVIVIPDETPGTGSFTYYVSRNNGTNWTQCSKETAVSLAGQPSGTQVRWKAVISGDAELNGIALALT
jgi:hypothetical protein